MNFFPWYPECITEVCHFHSIYYLWVICQTMEEKNLQRIVKMQLKTGINGNISVSFWHNKGQDSHVSRLPRPQTLQDTQNKNILLHIAFGRAPNALEQYRHSELFQSTWTFVKQCLKNAQKLGQLISSVKSNLIIWDVTLSTLMGAPIPGRWARPPEKFSDFFFL